MDFAAGTWDLTGSENFDEYMKVVGVGLVTRKMGNTIKPSQIITVDGDKWTIKTVSTFKNSEINFTLGQEFEENTIDGRKAKSVMTLEGKKLTCIQTSEPVSTITREWDDDTMKMVLTANDVTCTRTYTRRK